MRLSLLLFTLCYFILECWCCEREQYQNGCKIYGNTCWCTSGCPHEYIYGTRRECLNALRALQAQTVPPTPIRSYNTAPPTPGRWPNPAQRSYTAPPTANRWPITPVPTPARWPNTPVPTPKRWPNTPVPTASRWPNTPQPTPLRSQNICDSLPCIRGYCLQTSNEPGYTCKCDGTGFYGLRCEKPCPISPISGRVFPHECIII